MLVYQTQESRPSSTIPFGQEHYAYISGKFSVVKCTQNTVFMGISSLRSSHLYLVCPCICCPLKVRLGRSKTAKQNDPGVDKTTFTSLALEGYDSIAMAVGDDSFGKAGVILVVYNWDQVVYVIYLPTIA